MNEFLSDLGKIGEYLLDAYEGVLPTLQTFSLVITGVLLFFVLMAMKQANVIGGKKEKFIDKWNLADLSKAKVQKTWNGILQDAATGESVKMKKAINEADKLLEGILREWGFAGKTMDERLSKVDESKIGNLKEVWQAHNLSERIKKDMSFVITQNEAWNIIHIYERALRDHRLID